MKSKTKNKHGIKQGGKYKMTNAVIFDGDGDGTSAAAIWLLDKPEKYLAVTNKHKSDRKLVKEIFNLPKYQSLNRIGIFDIDAEQNIEALKKIPNYLQVDFIDHHTKDSSIIPTNINNLTQKDTRENCTSTISYDVASKRGILNSSNLVKATQLAIIGLGNDSKGRASQNFGRDLILPENRNKLIQYAKAINFGAATGTMDSKKIFNGFVESDIPLNYLVSAEEPNKLIEDRSNAIISLGRNSKIQEKEEIVFYQLPFKTNWDKELSTIGYNEFMNTQMEKEPNKIHLGLIESPDGKYTFSARSQEGHAYNLIENIAKIYNKTAFGRNTAAGFSTGQKIERKNLLEKILKARE